MDKKSRRETAIESLVCSHKLFRCPICYQAMNADGQGLFCPAGHRYDISRKGTVCLDRYYGDRDTHYGSELFESRRRIWEDGFFSPLTDRLCDALQGLEGWITDAGCGEGSLAATLQRKLGLGVLGMDLSAQGIAAAARFTNDRMLFCRADLSNLPLCDGAVSAVLNVLSPASYEEFHRVLSSGGRLIKVAPTALHLQEMRINSTNAGEEAAGLFLSRYPGGSAEELTYTLPCSQAQWVDLAAMSPLSWQGEVTPYAGKITFSFLLLFGWIS